ncbi:hypothetical protein OBBRIDRAFT_237434 [Obba rivulosa]|uniref:Uncharacterized protein n=1 Tax=Obba rivulosa TaxID=1052685 RepID=A0A8E2J791_9APHY|nr:hypothetical protein OBBRIDRAFT_237434 [Obba rivulosa]
MSRVLWSGYFSARRGLLCFAPIGWMFLSTLKTCKHKRSNAPRNRAREIEDTKQHLQVSTSNALSFPPRLGTSRPITASSSRPQDQAVLSFPSFFIFLLNFFSYLWHPSTVPEGGWTDCVHPGADLYAVLGTSTSRSAWLSGSETNTRRNLHASAV